MNEHEKINYLELPSKDIEASKAFFSAVFEDGAEDLPGAVAILRD